MNTPNDEMILFLRRIEPVMQKPDCWFVVRDKDDFPYYDIAFKAKYIEKQIDDLRRVRLTNHGITALAHLINITDHQGREIERHNREIEQHTHETDRHIREVKKHNREW
jgi:hypothetical protein